MRANKKRVFGIIFLDEATTVDGVVAAVQLAALVFEEGKTHLARSLKRAAPILERSARTSRRQLEQMRRTRAAMRNAENALGDDGRVLVRWSDTHAKLRVMVEGDDEALIRRLTCSILEAAGDDMTESPAEALRG